MCKLFVHAIVMFINTESRVSRHTNQHISSSPLTDESERACDKRECLLRATQPRGNGNERGNVRCYSSERCRLCADRVSRVNFFVNVNNYFFFLSRSCRKS